MADAAQSPALLPEQGRSKMLPSLAPPPSSTIISTKNDSTRRYSDHLTAPAPSSIDRAATFGHQPIASTPSPSILDKYLSKTPYKYSPRSTPSPSPSFLLKNKDRLNLFHNNSTSTTTSPFGSDPVSDIKARLQQLSRSSPSITTNSNTTTRMSGRDFTIPAASLNSSSTSSSTMNSKSTTAEGLASRARANQLQAELHLRDLEVKKLAVATAEARRERDEERQRANRLESEIQRRTPTPYKKEEEDVGARDNTHLSPLFQPYSTNSNSDSAETAQLKKHVTQLESALKKKEMELAAVTVQKNTPVIPPLSDTTTTTTIRESIIKLCDDGADGTLAELHKEANLLKQQAEMAAAELQGQRARADAAEERVRLTETRLAAAESSQQALEAELRTVKQKVPPMDAELRRLAQELASAEDRAALAERSLAEERARGGNSSGGTASSKAGAIAEVALTAQVRALQSQLRAAQGAAATARQELVSLRAETQGHESSREGATAELLSANRELEAAAAAAVDDLDRRGEELQQARAAMAQLSQENAALHATLQERTQSFARAEAAELQVAALQQELKSTKMQIAQLEDAMARGGSSFSSSPSPLRDVVGSLRTELQDRELRLAAADEELVSERRRAAELHRQVLDQAVEIDELQSVVHQGDGVLREELRQARAEVKSLTEKLASSSAEAGDGGDENENRRRKDDDTRELMQERDVLRRDLDEREAEVMVLQGQLHLLMASRDGEVENWLTGP